MSSTSSPIPSTSSLDLVLVLTDLVDPLRRLQGNLHALRPLERAG